MSDPLPIKILLVEDDEDCIDLTKTTLERAGILNSLEVVRTGKAAISAAGAIRPQVVLLDWKLPDLSGADVLNAVKRECSETTVIVLSVHMPERTNGCDAAPDYFMSKPIDPIQFLMALKSAGRFGFSIVDLGIAR